MAASHSVEKPHVRIIFIYMFLRAELAECNSASVFRTKRTVPNVMFINIVKHIQVLLLPIWGIFLAVEVYVCLWTVYNCLIMCKNHKV